MASVDTNSSVSPFVRAAGLAALLLLGPLAREAVGQSGGPTRDSLAQIQSAQFGDAKDAHLWRVGAWGGVNALGGLALVWASSRSAQSTRWHFGAMSAGWGLVNAGIAAGGLLGSGGPPAEAGPLLAAERQFHDVLLLNLGLNVSYSAVGATMLGASHYGIDNVGRWRGFGASLILQGVGLLVLDGIAFWASRGRLSSLLDAGVQLSVQAGPTGAAVALQF
ncbi:DUF6992 family protein [Salinibacter grassmerensis]|uniref:DUF6992 family protein n=1 Tax=Salinibacter grassmerensis TaxID=3040353 RepID=UPI0021E6EE01|nr:hypothetical protein [Salinibacter grassmerensis]